LEVILTDLRPDYQVSLRTSLEERGEQDITTEWDALDNIISPMDFSTTLDPEVVLQFRLKETWYGLRSVSITSNWLQNDRQHLLLQFEKTIQF